MLPNATSTTPALAQSSAPGKGGGGGRSWSKGGGKGKAGRSGDKCGGQGATDESPRAAAAAAARACADRRRACSSVFGVAHAAMHWKNYPLAQRAKWRRQEIEVCLGACAREERAFLLHCLTAFVLRINCPDGTVVALRVYPRQSVRALKQAIATVSRGTVSGLVGLHSQPLMLLAHRVSVLITSVARRVAVHSCAASARA